MKLDENAQTNGVVEEEEMVVTPWDVSTKSASGVDYDKLISKQKSLFINKVYLIIKKEQKVNME